MSVVCGEDGIGLRVSQEAYCVTTADATIFTAICRSHVDSIPVNERRDERISGGMDIHMLFGKPNGYSKDPDVDTLSLAAGIEIGDYRFSISESVARLILPETCKLYAL